MYRNIFGNYKTVIGPYVVRKVPVQFVNLKNKSLDNPLTYH